MHIGIVIVERKGRLSDDCSPPRRQPRLQQAVALRSILPFSIAPQRGAGLSKECFSLLTSNKRGNDALDAISKIRRPEFI